MNEWQLALAVIAGTIGILTFIWKIVVGSKNDVQKLIQEVDEKVEKRHDENMRLADARLSMLQAMKDQMSEKPSYAYLEDKFARKDIVSLQLQLVNEKLKTIEEILEDKK